MKKSLATLSTAVLVVCAVTITSLVVRRELVPSASAAAAAPVKTRVVPGWRTYVEGERVGPADTKVTIVEFSDFECPFCRETASRIRAIRERYPRDVSLVYRHYPLAYHPNATAAARASVCASRQRRFEGYHDALFAKQDSLGLIAWARLAADVGVPDIPAFEACMGQAGPMAEIERDLQAGSRLGVQGTPAILVNDRLFHGAPPGVLEDLVERAIRQAARR